MTTKIEWCLNPDGTPGERWNPITGCSRISAGCANCYAERMVHRLAGRFGYPEDAPFDVTLHADRLEEPFRWRKPRGVFVCSMGDLFHDDVGRATLQIVFSIMASLSEHTFFILTKRPERMRRWVRSLRWVCGALPLNLPPHRSPHLLSLAAAPQPDVDVEKAGGVPLEPGWVPPNVWLGVSVEDQATADDRIRILLDTPAAKRIVSYEPALGGIDVRPYLIGQTLRHMRADVGGMLRNRSFDGLQHDDGRPMSREEARKTLLALREEGVNFIPVGDKCDRFTPEEGCLGHPRPGLDWCIAGGESGPRARPAHPDWFRSLRDQCQAAGVPFFFKQWGEWMPCRPSTRGHYITAADEADPKTGFMTAQRFAWKSHDRVPAPWDPKNPFKGDGVLSALRCGKKRAGRELDGRTWDERPDLVSGSESRQCRSSAEC